MAWVIHILKQKKVRFIWTVAKVLHIFAKQLTTHTMTIQNAERTKRAIIHAKKIDGYTVTIQHYNTLANDWLVVFSNKQPAIYSKNKAIEWAESIVG